MRVPATISVNLDELLRLTDEATGKVAYKFGAKVAGWKSLAEVIAYGKLDCSGWIEWVMNHAAPANIPVQGGSWQMHQHCAAYGFKPTSYTLNTRWHDGRLRIAFLNPHNERAGHVWLIHNGFTIECYGGNGVGRRPWDNPALVTADACYVLTDPLKTGG